MYLSWIHGHAYIIMYIYIYHTCHIYTSHIKTFLDSVKDPKHVVFVSQQKLPKKENIQRANKVEAARQDCQRFTDQHSLAQMPPKGKNPLTAYKRKRNLSYCFWILFGLFFLSIREKSRKSSILMGMRLGTF